MWGGWCASLHSVNLCRQYGHSCTILYYSCTIHTTPHCTTILCCTLVVLQLHYICVLWCVLKLYNEVVARRGGNEGGLQKQPNDITLLPVANKDSGRYNTSCHSKSNGEHPVGTNLPASLGKGCDYQLNNGYGYADGYPGNAGMEPALEILQGYLGHGKSQKNSSTAKTVSQPFWVLAILLCHSHQYSYFIHISWSYDSACLCLPPQKQKSGHHPESQR